MIVTISGTPGSGKSTIAKILVEKLKAERIYIGGTLREMAKEKGMKVEEFLEFAKKHPEIDQAIDKKTAEKARKLAKTKDVVVEGRVQFHFLPESIKLFIKVAPEEAAKRIWKDLRDITKSAERNEEAAYSLKEMEKKIIKREEEDAKRYRQLYGFDHRDETKYDFVLNTTNLTVKEAVEKAIKFIESKKVHF